MSTSGEDLKNNRGINDWVEVVMGLLIYLFEATRWQKLTLMDPINITDENKLTNWAQNNKRCYCKYVTHIYITQPNLAILTHWQLFEKHFIPLCNMVQRTDRTVSINIP